MPFTSRAQAKTVKCPTCGAAPGQLCMGKRRPRQSSHLERHEAYQEAQREEITLWPNDAAGASGTARSRSNAAGASNGSRPATSNGNAVKAAEPVTSTPAKAARP